MDRQKYLDQREVKILRAVTESRSIKDMEAGRGGGVLRWMVVDTAMSTGLRVAEFAALRCGDVNLSRSCLTVTRSKRKIRKPETMAIGTDFAEHLREFMEWKSRVGQPTGETDSLFMGERGPLSAQGLQQIWKRAIRDAGLPSELSIHSARHTVAVHLLRKTRSLRQVQKQLGHASPATTGIADVFVSEDSAPTIIDLNAAFADIEDLAGDLIYTVEGYTNSALFDSLTIDAAGALTLTYAANAYGSSDLTIRATDTGGQFVETGLSVQVASVNDIPTTTGPA